jgi:lactoylglutathione lyase
MQIFVIRSTEMDRTKAFFEQLGLTLVEEKHGSGPTHWACEQNGVVFEIYPAKKNNSMEFFNPLTTPNPSGKST